MQGYLWQRFQGVFYGLLLAQERSSIPSQRMDYIIKNRHRLFERLTYFNMIEWDICKIEKKTIGHIEIAEFALLSIPLVLFFHDKPSQLKSQLELLGTSLELNSASIEVLHKWSLLLVILLQGLYPGKEKDFLHSSMKLKVSKMIFVSNVC
jgi:hypothetical protein